MFTLIIINTLCSHWPHPKVDNSCLIILAHPGQAYACYMVVASRRALLIDIGKQSNFNVIIICFSINWYFIAKQIFFLNIKVDQMGNLLTTKPPKICLGIMFHRDVN